MIFCNVNILPQYLIKNILLINIMNEENNKDIILIKNFEKE